MIRRLLIALCAFVLMVSVAGVAYAADLGLSSPTRPSLGVAERCAQTTVTIAGTAWVNPLTVSGLPPACGGLPLKIWLHDSDSTHTISTEVPPEGGEVTLSPAFSVGPHTDALATIDSWPMPTTMEIYTPFVSCRTPQDLSLGCTAEATDPHGWPDGYWQSTVTISTTSQTSVEWELMFNLDDSSVPVQPTRYLSHYGGLTPTSVPDCDAAPRTVTAAGDSEGWHNERVGGDGPTSHELGVQGSRQVGDPAAHTALLACP